MREGLTRRLVAAGLTAAPLAACAAPGTGGFSATLQVNLASGPLPPPPLGSDPGEADGAIRTGFDAVRRMTVEAFVDGSGPFRFVVDTGANRTVLASELAESLGLETSGQAMVHGIAGEFPSRSVLVKRLTVGGLLSRRVRMPVLPRQFLGADGLLGVDSMAHRRAMLNFADQSFALSSSADGAMLSRDTGARASTRPSADEIVVPARHRFGQLTIIDAELGGVPVTAFLDSGAEITVGNTALQREVLSRPGLITERPVSVQLVSATGQLVDGEMAVVPPLRLGGVRLGNLSCVFADLHTFRIWQLLDRPAILVGVDVMRHFDSIELDFGRRKVRFRSQQFNRSRAAQ